MIAFILVGVPARRSAGTAEFLRGLAGVREAYAIFGEYDLIAKVEVSDTRALGDLVVKLIQGHPEVTRTMTLITIEGI